MSYIDGFVIAVPTANKQKFIAHARHFDAMFIELGAIRVTEAWGDDVPDGKLTDFRRAVQATAEETVAFSWVEWPDKATRDAGMKKMMEDPRMDPTTPGNPPMPFDGKRMIFGGFEPVFEVKFERIEPFAEAQGLRSLVAHAQNSGGHRSLKMYSGRCTA
jgi:uncharacterized protein YbaA (DUF1428 family)